METSFMISGHGVAVNCILTQPEFGPVRRVVLGVHGMGGSTADEIQAGIASEMVLFGSAVLRFDLPGHGNSPESVFSLENCVSSLLAVAEEARGRFPDTEDLCVFASGFGAFVTLNALEALLELPGRVRLVVQTPSVRMEQTLLSMIGRSRETLEALGHVTVPTARPLDITFSFYKELLFSPVMAEYPIPILILHGEADDFIRMEDIQTFHRINEDSRLVIIPGTSHRFLEEGAWDMVLDLTRDWFEFEQVLLSDWD